MHLIQLLLPLYSNDRQALPQQLFIRVRDELVERFSGLWQEHDGQTTHDEFVIYEAMTEQLDQQWWSRYRVEPEKRFRQETPIVRAQEIRILQKHAALIKPRASNTARSQNCTTPGLLQFRHR